MDTTQAASEIDPTITQLPDPDPFEDTPPDPDPGPPKG
jgi:hypothetical protein